MNPSKWLLAVALVAGLTLGGIGAGFSLSTHPAATAQQPQTKARGGQTLAAVKPANRRLEQAGGQGETLIQKGRPPAAPARQPVTTVLGPKAFRDGDVIEITDARATSPKLEQGDSVTVRGRVRLASKDQAQLGLYLTQTKDAGPADTDPSQVLQVKRGVTAFELKITIAHRGVLHLTLYDNSGRPFGGVYFGTAEQMKRIAEWPLDYYLKEDARAPG
jgi:hypothetical protein